MKKLKKIIIGVSMLGAVVVFVPACSNSIKQSEVIIEENTSIEDESEDKVDNGRYIWGQTGNNGRGGGGGTSNTSSFS